MRRVIGLIVVMTSTGAAACVVARAQEAGEHGAGVVAKSQAGRAPEPSTSQRPELDPALLGTTKSGFFLPRELVPQRQEAQ